MRLALNITGLKEGRIGLAEFGAEVPDSVGALLDGTDISIGQLQEWGKAVAQGGDVGSEAFFEVTKALSEVEDETLRNQLGVELFGTLWEDQGKNITDTVLNAADGTANLAENTEQLADDVEKVNSDPAVALQKAFNDVMTALQPLLTDIADLISKFAAWASENPVLLATIAAVVTVLGILIGAFAALAPIVSVITTLAPILATAVGAITLPVTLVIAGIVALIAIGVALYKNWEEVSAFASTTWNNIKVAIEVAVQAAGEFVSNTWQAITETLSGLWTSIQTTASTVWTAIQTTFTTITQTISTTISTIWNSIRTTLVGIWNGISSAVTTTFNAIRNTITTVFNSVSSTVVTIWNTIKGTVVNTATGIVSSVTSTFNGLVGGISDIFNTVYTTVTNIWGTVQGFFEGIDLFSIGADIINGLINGIGSLVGTLFDKVTSIAGSIKDAFTSALDIHSPSRVFRGYGININEGLAIGLEKSTNLLDSALNNAYGGFADSAERALYSGDNSSVNNVNNSRTFNPNISISAGPSASEIARASERALRKLSYQL